MAHDIGTPYDEYRRSIVLLSDDFRYFGGSSAVDLGRYPEITRMLRDLKQGHWITHPPERERALRSLQRWAWRRFPSKVVGPPTQKPDPAHGHCSMCQPQVRAKAVA